MHGDLTNAAGSNTTQLAALQICCTVACCGVFDCESSAEKMEKKLLRKLGIESGKEIIFRKGGGKVEKKQCFWKGCGKRGRRLTGACLTIGLLFCLFAAAWQEEALRQAERRNRTDTERCYELTVLVPVTGALAYIGEPVQWTMEYAQDVINAAGGINGTPVRITVLDTECSTEKVKSQISETIKEQRILIGPIDTPGTMAGLELILEHRIPNIATYSYEEIRTQTAPYGISYLGDTEEGEMEAVKHWKRLNPDIHRVIILASPTESSQMDIAELLEGVLKQLEMEFVEVVWVEQGEERKAVVQALNDKADGYISLVRAEEHGIIVSELRKRGITEGRRFTASFASYERGMIEKYQEVLADTYIWNKFDADYPGEAWGKLVAAYQKDHEGKAPGSHVVPDMYNVVMAWKQCLEELGLKPEPEDLERERAQIAEWFYNSPVLEGIQGEYQWIEGSKTSAAYYFQFDEEGGCILAPPEDAAKALH